MNKSGYKVLVLTDHTSHSSENSIYSILRELNSHPHVKQIDVASRGIDCNKGFFQDKNKNSLFATSIDNSFKFDPEGKIYGLGQKKIVFDNYDIYLLRLPRPISDDFLLWLDAMTQNKPTINRPRGILTTSNKRYLLNFKHLCPPIEVVNTIDQILQFSKEYPIVLKPLKEYGGKGILKVDGMVTDDGDRTYNTIEYLDTIASTTLNEGYLAMKFLKNVNAGDKRIIVVDGSIMAASLRMPPDDSWICNVARGGKAIHVDVEPEEVAIVENINPFLRAQGILIYGVDTLVNDDGKRVLSEINTLSIGGFPQAQRQSGKPIIKETIKKIISYVDNSY